MPRKGPVKIKEASPDPIYKNRLITKLVNRIMHDGKKSVAQKEVYAAMDLIKEKGEDPIKIFSRAMENIKPAMEVRPRRVGGAAYQVPIPVRGPRKESLAIRWLVFATQAKSNSEFKSFGAKLASELMDAANNEGGAVKKRLEIEKIAEANRAFSHFRW
jgi:small subunit ribosomal protein S7